MKIIALAIVIAAIIVCAILLLGFIVTAAAIKEFMKDLDR